MRIATTASVALLALSTAALAQVATAPAGQTMQNNMMGSNSTMPGAPMTNHSGMDHSMPMNDTMAPDNAMTPPGK